MFNNKTYDILKAIALYVAPVATFIGAICIIWGVPYSEQITATLAAFDALLGSLLGVSTSQYNKINAVQSDYNNEGDSMLEEVEDYEDAENTAE